MAFFKTETNDLRLSNNLKSLDNVASSGASHIIAITTIPDTKALILNHIDAKIISSISCLQEQAYVIGDKKAECYICMEDEGISALECRHSICTICYNSIHQNLTLKGKCPSCSKPMKTINVNKCYSVMTFYTQEEIEIVAILYLPLIYDKSNDQWLEYEIFKNVSTDAIERSKLDESITRISDEKYFCVIASDKIYRIIGDREIELVIVDV